MKSQNEIIKWKFKTKSQNVISKRNLRNQISKRHLKAKSQSEIKERGAHGGPRSLVSLWFRLDFVWISRNHSETTKTQSQNEISKQNHKTKSQNEITKRNLKTKSQNEISKRNHRMKSQNEITERNH